MVARVYRMPIFKLDQQNELKVWDSGFAAAERTGYMRYSTRKKIANPLAATAYTAGFMGGAFLGHLPSWIEDAFEANVLSWIKEGYVASHELKGIYVGLSYEANTGGGGECVTEEGKIDIQGLSVSLSCDYGPSQEEFVEMVTGPLSDEMWRPILYYPGGFVSNLGRIRDWKDIRRVWISPSHVHPSVDIPYGGSQLVHRVAAETWIGPLPKGFVTCHNNDNKLDARVINLRYDTPEENAKDRARNRKSRVKSSK